MPKHLEAKPNGTDVYSVRYIILDIQDARKYLLIECWKEQQVLFDVCVCLLFQGSFAKSQEEWVQPSDRSSANVAHFRVLLQRRNAFFTPRVAAGMNPGVLLVVHADGTQQGSLVIFVSLRLFGVNRVCGKT